MARTEPLLHRALRWAYKKHRGQDRDGVSPLPYATHPADVANRLRYEGGVTEEATLAAAFLHDVLEESDASMEDLRREFGDFVADLVAELTRREPAAAEIEGLSETEVWELRSRMLLEDIERMSPEAMTVKLADRASNLASAWATRTGDKLERYLRQTYRILEAIPREVNPALWDSVRRQLPGS